LFDIVAKNGNRVECCFYIVAGVDGALEVLIEMIIIIGGCQWHFSTYSRMKR